MTLGAGKRSSDLPFFSCFVLPRFLFSPPHLRCRQKPSAALLVPDAKEGHPDRDDINQRCGKEERRWGRERVNGLTQHEGRNESLAPRTANGGRLFRPTLILVVFSKQRRRRSVTREGGVDWTWPLVAEPELEASKKRKSIPPRQERQSRPVDHTEAGALLGGRRSSSTYQTAAVVGK